jgi:predicted amidohydrolase
MTPIAKTVKPLKDYKLLVGFDNGETKIYNAAPLIRGDWFGQLKNISEFNTVHIAGISVEWSGGQDVCPDDLYYNSVPV